MTYTYNPILVLLSYAIAVLSAYCALVFVRKLEQTRSRERNMYLLGGAVAMGNGIWSMHFVGMLALDMDMAMSYDVPLTVLSGILAIVSSGAALYLATNAGHSPRRLILGGVLCGLGISAMHYVGMAGMDIAAEINYDTGLLLLSILVGIVAAIAALWLFVHQPETSHRHARLFQVLASLVMGVAICGMHYTGMAAADYMPISMSPSSPDTALPIGNSVLAIVIALVSTFVLGLMVMMSGITHVENRFKRLSMMIAIMLGVAMSVGLTATKLLYETAYTQEQQSLRAGAMGYAAMLNSVARFDSVYSRDANEGGAAAATISQGVDALLTMSQQQNLDEIILFGKTADGNIAIYGSSSGSTDSINSILLREQAWARPFVQALDGHSGSYEFFHYLSGAPVLLAYEPLPQLNAGIIALRDLEELRAPFVRAALIVLVTSCILVAIAAMLLTTIDQSVVKKLQREVRDRKNAELAVIQANETLENRVEERTLELVSANQFHERLMDSISSGIFVLNRDNCIKVINPGGVHICGLSYAELMGLTGTELFDPDEVERIHGYLGDIRHKGMSILQQECRLRARSTVQRTVNLSLAPMFENGVVTNIVGVLEDITAIKQSTDAMSAALEQAREASRSKSEFLANMSHEIRTPMNGVLGMLQLLAETRLDKEQQEFARTAASSAETLLHILNDILDLSKIEAGKMSMEIIEFNLRELVEDVAALFAETAHNKGLEIAVSVAANVPNWVQGDPVRLRQVLSNLTGNAVKFTEQGEVVIRLNLDARQNNEVVVRFEVVDTGVGIAQHNQSRIFESFQQEDGSTTRRFGGTGLGLAISRQLAEMMGGEIGLRSAAGAGSTFWFTARMPVASNQAREAGYDHMHNLRLLVVDDNQTNRIIVSRMLESWHFESDSAADGYQALECVRSAVQQERPYDVILLDMMMPGMDGIEFANRVRDEQLLGDTRIILLTSMSMSGRSNDMAQAGIFSTMSKPIRQSLLFNGIMSHAMSDVTGPEPTGKPGRVPVNEAARLLVVEDNSVNQKVALGMLRKLGYKADLAANGKEAVQMCNDTAYDIVFMDCHMPVMDGYEATRQIRRVEQGGRQTVIVAMTANAMKGDEAECLAVGMDGYISKPLKLESLEQALAQWLPGLAVQA